MNNQYPKLLEPYTIKKTIVKNRTIFSPIDDGMADTEGYVTDQMIAYYEERAKGGTGMIMIGMVSPEGQYATFSHHQCILDDEKYLPKFTELIEAIHSHGAVAIPQIAHCGWNTDSTCTRSGKVHAVSYNGFTRMVANGMAASGVKKSLKDSQVEVLTTKQMDAIIDKFIKSSWLAQQAGADGVELHCAHGYLLNEVLSRLFNQRMDKYGGNLKKRGSYVVKIIEGIRKACGEDYIIAVRIPAMDYLPLGLGLSQKDVIELAKMFEKAGADLIDITGGIDPTSKRSMIIEPQGFEEGFRANNAKQVKEALNIPVTTVGVLRTPEFCNGLIERGVVDFVSIGRGLLADPYWVQKAEQGKAREIRRCISCNEGCIGRLAEDTNNNISCTVNPMVGREVDYYSKENSEKKKILIVGAGPAGLQAAVTAAALGHQVQLIEKESVIGGQLNIAKIPPDKDFIGFAVDWYKDEIQRLNVDLQLNTEATEEMVKATQADHVIIATGAQPFVPPIKGIHKGVASWDVLHGKVDFNGNEQVVVIGGGLVGLETGLMLAEQGNKVTVVEMADTVLAKAESLSKTFLMNTLKANNVKIITSAKVTEVGDSNVYVDLKGRQKAIRADKVVTAIGQRPDRKLYEGLASEGSNIHIIGDSDKVGKIITATEAAFELVSTF